MLAVGELRYEDAWEDMLACHRFVFLARSGCYCASEIDNMYFARTKQVFQVELLLLEHLKNLDSRKIDQIRDELFRLPKENKNVRLFDLGERFVCMENLEEAISGKFAFTFELSQGTYSQEELKIMLDEAKPLINESVDTIIKALKEPNYQQRMTLLRPLEVRLNKQYPIGILTTDKLAAYAAPHHNYLKNDVACLMREKLVEVAIVLEDYNRNNHGYPNTLKQLIPNYISEVPNDEYNGKKIKYTHKDKGYFLYSVGENGNDDTLEVENNEKD